MADRPAWWAEAGLSCAKIDRHRGMLSRRAGLTLIEILVVVGIVGVLVAIAVPSLAAARRMSHRAVCASNQRQIGMTANLYAADHRGYLGQADALDYRTASATNNGKALPASFIDKGMTNPLTRQPDHYLAWGYLSVGTNARGNLGHEIYLCPAVRHMYANLGGQYAGGVGNAESHYFFSTLLHRPTSQNTYRAIRNNAWGPYRNNQIKRPEATFLAGDAVAIIPGTGNEVIVAMQDLFTWENVGELAGVFGVSAMIDRMWKDNALPHHPGGPNGLYFDGHVAAVQVPDANNASRYHYRSHFTANFSGELH